MMEREFPFRNKFNIKKYNMMYDLISRLILTHPSQVRYYLLNILGSIVSAFIDTSQDPIPIVELLSLSFIDSIVINNFQKYLPSPKITYN